MASTMNSLFTRLAGGKSSTDNAEQAPGQARAPMHDGAAPPGEDSATSSSAIVAPSQQPEPSSAPKPYSDEAADDGGTGINTAAPERDVAPFSRGLDGAFGSGEVGTERESSAFNSSDEPTPLEPLHTPSSTTQGPPGADAGDASAYFSPAAAPRDIDYSPEPHSGGADANADYFHSTTPQQHDEEATSSDSRERDTTEALRRISLSANSRTVQAVVGGETADTAAWNTQPDEAAVKDFEVAGAAGSDAAAAAAASSSGADTGTEELAPSPPPPQQARELPPIPATVHVQDAPPQQQQQAAQKAALPLARQDAVVLPGVAEGDARRASVETAELESGSESEDESDGGGDYGDASETRHTNSLFGIGGNRETVRYAARDAGALGALKRDEIDKVRAFEARRRSFFQAQHMCNGAYWQALKDVARDGGAAVNGVLSWYRLRLSAQRAYAASLLDMNDSIAGIKKGTSARAVAASTQRPGGSALIGEHEREKKAPANQAPLRAASVKALRAPGRSGPLGAAGAADGNGELLDELCAMDCVSAAEAHALANALEDSACAQLQRRQDDISAEMRRACEDGDQCLSSMLAVEDYVLKAYEALHRAAADGLAQPVEYMDHPGSTSIKTQSAAPDMWLADMNYRMAVQQQRQSWGGMTSVMACTLGRLRDLELDRRHSTKVVIEDTLRKQAEASGRLPTAANSVFKCLTRLDVDAATLEKTIRKELKRQPSVTAEPQVLNEDDTAHMGPDGIPAFVDDFAGPMDSPLMIKAAVLQRKDKKNMSSKWVPALVVLTKDTYLHVFDLGDTPVGKDPKAAMNALLPPVDMGTVARLDKSLAVTPSQSLDLSAYIVGRRAKQTQPKHARQLHVIEIKQNTGFKKAFKKESQRKASLRAHSESEMGHWKSLFEGLAGEAV
ncbi:hypothetical protein JKP88DRAFT_323899 [Tribonema minus]|uniref:PH domain-containing protein n=1 Tax=Tribonema minus TaxID=303371 RepID=A0A835YTK9_9STRA|nr:hypothetical protein JKP88DRAFT_323899 [Tribonema minus]